MDSMKHNSFLSADLLPSLGASINDLAKLRKHIVSPVDPRFRCLLPLDTPLAWEMWLVILVIYSAWICPFEYLSTWFVFDVCPTAPFKSLSLLFNYKGSQIGFTVLSTLRLWRLRRVSLLFARLEKDIRFNYFWTRCTKLILMLSSVLYMLFYLGFTSYLIGNMTNLVVHWSSHTKAFRDTVTSVSEFASRNQLPPNIHDQMLSHISLDFKTEAIDAEYFPPREDVIIQNESHTDHYILVSGAVEFTAYIDGENQIQGKEVVGDAFGEIGVLCYTPQPFTISTTELSQILRVHKKSLISVMRAHIEDGRIIINNLFMKLRGKQSIAIDVAKHQPHFLLQEWLGGGLKRGEGNASDQGKGHKYLQLDDSEIIDLELTKWMDSRKDGSSETRRGQEPNKDFAEKSFSNVDVASLKLTYPHCRFKPSKQELAKPEEKRVTIHLKSQGKDLPKLIILHDSKVELLGLAGEKFGKQSFTVVTNAENVEIDVIRDGEHLPNYDPHYESNQNMSIAVDYH
ncbi:hypothetical protein HID58_056568, partial [Brassica napus]